MACVCAGQVLVEAEPLALMDRHWQDSTSKPESGGILLGYRRGAHLHVTMATAPQASDRGWRYLFKRSARHHQEIALHQWNESSEEDRLSGRMAYSSGAPSQPIRD